MLIIGGYSDGYCDESVSYKKKVSSFIAKYTINKWEQVGNLQNSRYSHRAISNEDIIHIVGGNAIRFVPLY